jgi:hypothetical protein
MRRSAMLGALLLASAAALGQAADARRLLSEAVAAQGPAAAIAEVESLTAVADCTGPEGSSFKTEVISLRPDRARFLQDFGEEKIDLTVAGQVGWSRDAKTGTVKPMTEGFIGVVRGHEFHLMFLELERRNRDPRLSGRDTVGGKPCLVVSATDDGGRPTSVCIDEKTKLPVRFSYEPSGGPKSQTIHVVPSGWIEIAGIRWINGFTLRQGDEVFTYRYASIRPNSADPKMFDVPPDLRAPSPDGRGSG